MSAGVYVTTGDCAAALMNQDLIRTEGPESQRDGTIMTWQNKSALSCVNIPLATGLIELSNVQDDLIASGGGFFVPCRR